MNCKKSKKITCIFPARLQSTRFPKKVLATLNGKPLLQWCYEAAQNCALFDQIYFAVDAKEVLELVESFGAEGFLTSAECQSGTDRMIELMQRKEIVSDIWVNWQADEPFVDNSMIESLLSSVDDDCDVWTLKKKITSNEDLDDPNAVKVVTDKQGKALYFSRSRIPYIGDCYKHLGIYAFSNKALEKISTLSPCHLELRERLEQLRFLYNGLKIKVHEVDKETIGIDTPQDLAKAELFINSALV